MRSNRPLTVLGLVLGMGMGALEATIVSTAMPTVIGELGGIRQYAWVFTAYMLTSTVTVPIYGKLADLYGRKPLMLLGLVVFLAGSALSGQAGSMGQLVAFRALQGLGAGAIQPVALTIVGDLFDLEARARIQGVFGAIWGVSGLSGPLLGGWIVRALSWRWVFYINVPLGLASMALVAAFYREEVTRKERALDVEGAVVLTLAVLALLGSASGGAGALGLGLAVAALLLAYFARVETRAREPMLPLDLFATRVMWTSSLAGALVGAAMFGLTTFLPLYVQAVLGGTPTQAGAAITPMVVGWPIASTLGGRALPRVGFRPMVVGGLAISAVTAALLPLLLHPGGTSLLRVELCSAGFGFGLGLANTALLIAVQTTVPWERRGVATASTLFFRTIGGTLAVGFMGGVLAAALGRDPTLPPGAAARLLSPEHAGVPPELLHRVAGLLASGLATVFWANAAIAVAAFATGLLFPYVPTHATAGADAGAAAGH